MSKNIWIAAAGLVALALLYIFFAVSSSSSPSPTPSPSPDRRSTDSKAASHTGGPAAPKRYRADSKAPSTSAAIPGGDRRMTVRDHRGGASTDGEERSTSLPPNISKVQPATLIAVRTSLRPQMMKCIRDFAGDAEEGASAKAVLTVSISDELLRVDSLQLEVGGLEEAEPFRSCVNEAMLGHEQLVSGTENVEAHVMRFPYRL